MSRGAFIALLVLIAAIFTVGVIGMLRRRTSAAPETPDVVLVRAPDGRCWRAHNASVEADGDALSWRTDGGVLLRVRGADWIEVARGGGVNGQGLDWRGAAATLGVDLGRCLPAAECR